MNSLEPMDGLKQSALRLQQAPIEHISVSWRMTIGRHPKNLHAVW
ncbi:MAG: hypothetical protein OIF55_16790 [Amphritea sp.]|nr:hypothetical protein [Amphritea sp.]